MSEQQIYEGSAREVVRSGEWVIKTDKPEYAGACEDEFHNYLNLKDTLPMGVSVPETILLPTGQVKMRFVTGQVCGECFCIAGEECGSSCMTNSEHDIVSQFINDTAGFNVIRDENGTLWIIDMEF